MKKLLPFFIVLVAVFLSLLTRGYQLGEVPAGLYLDEAGQGYSAYSILLTGKDEFGKSFPLAFRNFTDFKTPIYIYLLTPLIPLFGLTALTVRLPSFIFSILTIPILYLLIKEITPKKYAVSIASITVLLLAISPWHILFGRTNFECNVALFFFLSGALTFYKGLQSPRWFVFSAILFAIAIPAYHAQRIVAPLFLCIMFIRFRRTILAHPAKKYVLAGCVIAFIILLPTLLISFTPGFLARANGLNIFSYSSHKPFGYRDDVGGIMYWIINNRIFLTTREFLSLYFSYLSPRNMFVLGDYGPRSSFPSLATFFIWQFPFYIIGLWQLLKKGTYKELRNFTFVMLLIAPIPAALTRDPYTTIRALQMVVPQTILIAVGIHEFYVWFTHLTFLRRIKRSYLLYGCIFFFILATLYSLARLYSSVIILNEYYRPQEWNYGWEETVHEIQKLDPDIPVIVDTARGEPYIEVLFFTKYPPTKYANENFEVTNEEYYYKMSRRDNWNIGNIHVEPLHWEKALAKEHYIVGDSLALSDDQIQKHNLQIIHETKYPDGTVAQRIVKTSN
jgi:4-amino-4-deoxy-L-arabinose transferase-like glycosyltransferase